MGCWDITCALTNLPIRKPDPVRGFFLREPMFDDSEWDHPWTKWIPVSVPVQGTYDEYGRIEGYEKSPVLQFQVECLRRHAVRESSHRDEDLLDRGDEDFPDTMESLLSACERGFLKLKLPYSDREGELEFKKLRTTAFVVHEEIYQHMVAPRDRNPPGIGTAHGRMERGHEFAQGNVERLRDAVEWAADRAAREELVKRNPEVAALLDEARGLGLLTGLTSRFDQTPDVLVVGNASRIDVGAWPSLQNFRDEDWAELGRRVHEQDVFFWTMRELRREFQPARYTDQYWYPDNNLDANRMLLRYADDMTKSLQEREKKEREDDDDVQD